jgi:hypothetical protein
MTKRVDDAARAAALSRKPVRPRFALGALVVDPHGVVGAIDAAYVDLTAAEDALVIDDAKRWLAELEKRPKTTAKGIWYSVVCATGGNVLVGEKDLRQAGRAPTSRSRS